MNKLQTREKLHREDILALFTEGFKPKSEHKIGMEFERLPVSDVTNNSIPYYGDFGVCNFLRTFAKTENWDYITDDYNIIGLKQGHDTITLEPGSQIELSIKPKNSIYDLKKKVDELNSQMLPILDRFNIKLLEYGVSPLSTHKNISLIPKRRYRIMAQYYDERNCRCSMLC